jgi:hypothetical protein
MMEKASIFIVEDEKIVANDIKETLISLGYTVVGTAKSGETVLQKVSETNPDIILMDIHLAGKMDGIETAEELHKISDIPVIYLTAFSDEALLDRAKITEPYGYLIKPYSERELISVIEMARYKYAADKKLKESEDRLRKLNDELESRVAARTATIQQHLRFLQVLIDTIPAPVYYKDSKGNYLGCNNAFETYTGIQKPEIIGKTDRAFLSSDMATLSDEKDTQLVNGKGIQVYTTKFAHADHQSRDVVFNKATFNDPDGSIAGFIGVMIDITDIKRAEDALRKSTEDLVRAQRVANIGNWRFNPVTQELHWSDQMYEIFTLPKSPPITYEIFHAAIYPDDGEHVLTVRAEALTGSLDFFDLEYRITIRGGHIRYIYELAEITRDERGKPVLVFGTSQDVTERILAEESLRQSEEKYRTVIENIQDIFYRTDDKGNLIMASPSLKTVLGYDSVEECLGKSVAELFYFQPEERTVFLKVLQQNSSVKDFELILKRKDGSPVSVATSSHFYYDKTGKVLGVEGVIRDITERKRSEVALVESLHEKELLLKEIHHRVKNNLQTISSLLYLQSLSTENTEQITLLKEARSRVMSMGLIHQKLYQSADIAHIPFMDYIRGLIDFLEESYGVDPEKIRTVVEVSPPDLTMELDTGIPCGLIINELVTNALKYAFHGPDGGIIRIQMKRDEHQYHLTVSDDGAGIPADLDLTTTKSLGMTIVTDLVSQLDGTLEIIRQPGTTYRIQFPYQ